MPNNLTLSAAALALLDMIEHQTGVSFEVLHLRLDPVRRSLSGDFAERLAEPDVTDALAKALRTGEVRLGQAGGTRFGAFPLRRAREIVGCLIASRRAGAADSSPATDRAIEEAGALARGILESDLLVHGQLAAAQAVMRRLHATLRFVGQLGSYDSDRDVMHAVLHAATVWFDLDCRIYERRPDGRFALSGALPGVEHVGTGQLLEADRAAYLVAAGRFPSAGDVDDLGLGGRKDEVLVLPVGTSEPAWLILLAGSLDSHAEVTFAAIARVLTADLRGRELAQVERWQQQVTERRYAARAVPGRVMRAMLDELLHETDAHSASVTAIGADGVDRELVSAGLLSPDDAVTGGAGGSPVVDPRQLEVTMVIGGGVSVRLLLGGAGPLRPTAATVAQTWLHALRPWLTELAVATAPGSRERDE